MASRRWTPRWTWGAVSLAPDPTRERPERTEWHLLADLLDVFEALSGQLFGLSREAIQAEADNTAAGQAHDGHVVEDPLRAPIHLLRARDRGGAEAFQDQRPARSWGECIRAGVVVGDVPRTHISKLAPPQLAVLG
jgi:hypothetical protein